MHEAAALLNRAVAVQIAHGLPETVRRVASLDRQIAQRAVVDPLLGVRLDKAGQAWPVLPIIRVVLRVGALGFALRAVVRVG